MKHSLPFYRISSDSTSYLANPASPVSVPFVLYLESPRYGVHGDEVNFNTPLYKELPVGKISGGLNSSDEGIILEISHQARACTIHRERSYPNVRLPAHSACG